MQRIGEVIREMTLARRLELEQLAADVPAPARTEDRMGLALRPGARVLDLVTGQEGTIDGGTRTHTIVPTAQR